MMTNEEKEKFLRDSLICERSQLPKDKEKYFDYLIKFLVKLDLSPDKDKTRIIYVDEEDGESPIIFTDTSLNVTNTQVIIIQWLDKPLEDPVYYKIFKKDEDSEEEMLENSLEKAVEEINDYYKKISP